VGGETAKEMMQFQEQIDEVLAAFTTAVSSRDAILLAKGRLDRAAIEAKLRASGAAEAAIGGTKGFTKDGLVLVLLDGGYAVAGQRAQVEDALSRADKIVVLPARFFQPAKSIPADSGAWAISVGRLPEVKVPERSNLANLPRLMQSVELATAYADLSAGVRMSAAATCTSEDDAKQIQTLFRGLVGMARLSTPNDKPELLKVFDRIELKQKERSVEVTADLPVAVIETLEGALAGFRRGD
jgi:hypothetical protein